MDNMILTDYRGIPIVRCVKCGHEYTVDMRECEECGSSESEIIKYDEKKRQQKISLLNR